MAKKTKKTEQSERERIAAAIDFRLQGHDYAAIAGELKCTEAEASALVAQGLAAIVRDQPQQTLLIDLERVNKALTEIVPNALTGEQASVRLMLDLTERRNKIEAALLPQTKDEGLVAPIKVKGGKGGRPEHVPTERSRALVEGFILGGNTQADIAKRLGISEPTLRKHYGDLIDDGKELINAEAAGKLIAHWRKGNLAALFFHLKTRAGYRETTAHELSGPDGQPLPTGVPSTPPALIFMFTDDGEPEKVG